MSAQSAQDFLSLLETDADFRDELINARSPAAKAAVIKSRGFMFTAQELDDAMADPETSQAAKDHAVAAANSIAREAVSENAIGGWLSSQ